MISYLKKVLADYFTGSVDDVRGTKRVPHSQTYQYFKDIDFTSVKLLERQGSKFNTVLPHDSSLPTLLIVDDGDVNSLYGADFQILNTLYKFNVYENFNVYQATGINCGLEAIKLINTIKIDYAILDLTLGNFCRIKEDSDKYVEIDGVDLGITLFNKNKEAKILFSTAHIFNTRYPEFQEYLDKFESATGLKFIEHYLNKLNDRRTEEFLEFLGKRNVIIGE